MRKAIFLDRDGVINIDKKYLYKIEDFEFCEGVFETLHKFQDLGYLLIIITNQSGIGRGYYSESDYTRLTNWMLKEFLRNNIKIDKVYHCPHKPSQNCSCRKPKPGMLQFAIKEFDIEPKVSWMIGDKKSDIEASLNAGIKNTIFVNTFACNSALYSVKSILDTINFIKI